MKRKFLYCLLLVLCLTICSCTKAEIEKPPEEQTPPEATPPTQTQQFQAQPNTNVAGPWDNDVLVFQVDTGGTVTKSSTFERSGVPAIARMKDGRLIAAHQFFPANDPGSFDKVAVRFSSDDGYTWTGPQVINLSGLPEGMRFPFDPTLLILPDGRIRLYFTSLHGRQFEEEVPAIYSAISTNGVDYIFEPGMRFGIQGRYVIDCAVVLYHGIFHLFAPDNGAQPDMSPHPGTGYHATSPDGLYFTRTEDVNIEGGGNWLGSAQTDGKVITFWGTAQATVPVNSGQKSGLWLASSIDSKSWKLLVAPPVSGADPGAVVSQKGGWVVVVTGPPRPGTPSAQRSQIGQTQQGAGQQSQPNNPSGSDGPSNHRIMLATSVDGLSWKVSGDLVIEQASVPELFLSPEGVPILVFVDASGQTNAGELGVMEKQPDGSWIRKRTNLYGADPNVVVIKNVGYRCYTKDKNGSILVFSSRNGLDWQLLGEAFRDDRYPQATDPDVFETPSGWVMLVSLGPRLLRCISADGLKFNAGEVIDLGGYVSDTVAVPGGWRTFFHVNSNPQTGGKMVIRSAFTTDGKTWRIEEGDRLVAPVTGAAQRGVADPAPLLLNDGTWLMAFKSFIN